MSGFHWLAFFLGVAFGALVLPFIMKMFAGSGQGS